MEIKQQHYEGRGKFHIDENGKRLAEMSYSMQSSTIMAIEHTEVDPSLRGLKVGDRLLEKALAFAREKQLKILPLCSFVQAIFKKDPSKVEDLWYKA
jgi:uncharacterized protein